MSLLKHYQKISLLGEGQFGAVYKMLNEDGEIVAVKKYLKLTDKDISYHILREINIMKTLKDHPHIIKIKEVYMGTTEIDVVMEYGGENMSDYGKRLSDNERWKQIKLLAYQLIIGCKHMHNLDIMHRDLKPQNILVYYNNEDSNPEMIDPVVKICDFGLAKKLLPFYRENNSYQICTLCYRPPELFTSEVKTYSEEIDIWAIGCVLFEFMIGDKLFPGRTDHAVLKNILQKVPTTQADLDLLHLENIRLDHCNTDTYYKLPSLYDLSLRSEELKHMLDQFESLVRSMLVLNPKNRISLAEALNNPFFDSIRKDKNKLELSMENYKIKRNLNYKIRPVIKIPNTLRAVWVEHILSLKNDFKINEQTVLIAINIFDQYLAAQFSRKEVNLEKLRNELMSIANICTVLASKYIDIKPLRLKNFVMKGCAKKTLIKTERHILEQVEFELNQPTLIDFYQEFINDGLISNSNIINKKHWKLICELITDYDIWINKDINQIKEIFLSKLV
jgi:serine/threonine protein kinase